MIQHLAANDPRVTETADIGVARLLSPVDKSVLIPVSAPVDGFRTTPSSYLSTSSLHVTHWIPTTSDPRAVLIKAVDPSHVTD